MPLSFLLISSRELTDSNQQEPSQIENYAKQKVRRKFEPDSDSAIGQHSLESNQCARNYSDSWF